LPDEGPLDARSLALVGRRLTAPAPSALRRTRQVWLVAAVLCSGAGAALAQWGQPLLDAIAPAAAPPSAVAVPSVVPRHGVGKSGTAPPRAEVEPAPAPNTDLPEVVAPGAVAARPLAGAAEAGRGVASATAEAVAAGPESALSRESALLSRALRALRRDHDAATALALLDQYRAQFPTGVLALEASTARVDALLLQGRRASALSLLASLPLERSPRRTELQLLRAELNAERDCARALADFDAVLGATASGPLAERALFGRAGCQLRLGRAAAGRADLESYAARFPSGRFAEQVQARLAESH
jgi:hypothetical protein